MPALRRVRRDSEDLNRQAAKIQAAGSGEGGVIMMPEYLEDPEDREDHICSTLRWSDVSLPPSVTEADLDALIFPELAQNWRKVARIVYRAFELREALSIAVSSEVIATRIQALVETGRIEGVGNLTMWRHSEVRLKSR
jgi:hypothetical protein